MKGCVENTEPRIPARVRMVGFVSPKSFGKQAREQLRSLFTKSAFNFDWLPALGHITIDWE